MKIQNLEYIFHLKLLKNIARGSTTWQSSG
jgi:hypothetical protein